MQVLLDTHAFLWFAEGDPKLSAPARGVIEDAARVKLVSVASIWEMAIKIRLGKLSVSSPFTHEFVSAQLEKYGFVLHPITVEHSVRVATLDLHHRDPFDRLLVAQCLVDDMPILSADAAFDGYQNVRRLW
jgi:PIN domain nuclease of toxin-antitoxin system